MKNEKTVYKLYYLAGKKPTKGLFLTPYALSLDACLCTLGAHFIAPDVEQLTSIGVGMCIGLFAAGCTNLKKYKKLKQEYDEYNDRLKVFLEEAKKIIGADATIGIDDMIVKGGVDTGSSFRTNHFLFKDNSSIHEVLTDGFYRCDYFRVPKFKDFDKESIDLTSAVKKAYSMNIDKKKKRGKAHEKI